MKSYTFPGFSSDRFQTLLEANLAQLEAVQKHLEGLEKSEYDRARASIDEGAKLMKMSLDMWHDGMLAWREEALAAQKQMTESLTAGV